MKHIDYKFSELCEEVDYWKSEAEYYKQKCKKLQCEMSERASKQLKQSQKNIGQILTLALAVDENIDGSLSISKENRKMLSKTFNS